MRVAGASLGLVMLLVMPMASAVETLEARVARLERQQDNQALVELLTRVERLQQEVQQLRGQVEVQGHQIGELKQRQRDLYLDIDRRLSRVERESGGQPAAAIAPSAPLPAPVVEPAKPMATAPVPVSAPAPVPVTNAAPVAQTPAPAVSAADADKERNAYQQAFDLLRELRYDQAITAFRSFLKEYPDGRYGHIAQYWMGEANYAQRNFKQAIVDYRQLLQGYPKSPKLAEAMLKIGYSHYESGDKGEAKKVLTELTQRYPDTTEAGQASAFLQKMRQEGN